MSNVMSTKYPFPATAPTSGQTVNILALTGKAATDARRIILTTNSSADSAANGLVFAALLDNGTVYRTFQTYTYLTADGMTTYRVACPVGASGLKVTYANSAATLSTWEGTIGVLYDEIAAA